MLCFIPQHISLIFIPLSLKIRKTVGESFDPISGCPIYPYSKKILLIKKYKETFIRKNKKGITFIKREEFSHFSTTSPSI